MGRRAKKAPVQTKKRPTLAKKFKCPFCANQESCECKMDFKLSTGRIECRLCGASFQMRINHLTEPIDVFSEWLDECEAAQNGWVAPSTVSGGGVPAGSAAAAASSSITQPQYQDESDDDDDDDDLGQPSGLKGSDGGGGAAAARSSSSAAAKKSSKSAGASSGRTYEDLGLGDSDDDSD